MADSNKKQNIVLAWRIAVAVLFVFVAVFSLHYLYKYMVQLQHLVYSDNVLFDQINLCQKALESGVTLDTVVKSEDGSVYAYLLALYCDHMTVNPVVFSHKIIPILFFWCFIVVYTLAGICLFKGEKRDIISIISSTCILLIVSVAIVINGIYSNLAVEGGVVITPWYGRTISSVLISPIILVGILLIRKSIGLIRIVRLSGCEKIEGTENSDSKNDQEENANGNKKKAIKRRVWGIGLLLLGITVCCVAIQMYLGFSVIDDWKSYSLAINDGDTLLTFYNSYFYKPWLLFLSIGLLIYSAFTKGKMYIPLLSVCVIACVCKVPIPLLLVSGYGAGYLCTSGKKENLWNAVSVLLVVGMVMMLGFFDKTKIVYKYDFCDTENAYKLPQSAIDVADYIMNEETDIHKMSITTYDSMYYPICQYTSMLTCKKFSNSSDDEMTSAAFLHEGSDSEYILLHSSKEVAAEELDDVQYGMVKTFGEYTLYAQTEWVETSEGWMHTAGDGSEYIGQGWHTIAGAPYYFNESGIMQTGWTVVEGEKYYLLESGGMRLYWQEIDGAWYYFDENGIMQHDCEVEGYKLGSDGKYIDN